MKKALSAGLMLTLAVCTTARAGSYNYLEPAQVKQWLESGRKVAVIDIQTAEEFKKHHLKGAIETNAFPAKTPEERRRLDNAVAKLAATGEDIVVVCPRGGGGAKNTCDYLSEKGIAGKRTYILKNGMLGWPYKELTVAEK